MNKPKAQGTAFETWLVNYWDTNLTVAHRLAERGSNDEGDLELWPIELGSPRWIIEAKARSNLNIHQTLAKAKQKSQTPWTVVVWKKLTRKGDNKRRSADGEPVIVAMDLETFTRLIS